MFKELFTQTLSENRKNLTSLENTKELRKEINRLSNLMLHQSDREALATKNNIQFLEKKLKEIF